MTSCKNRNKKKWYPRVLFGSPLRACGNWQVHTKVHAIVKSYNKEAVYCIFLAPIIDEVLRSRQCNVTLTSGCESFQSRTSEGKSRYVAKTKKKPTRKPQNNPPKPQKSFNTQRRKTVLTTKLLFSVRDHH